MQHARGVRVAGAAADEGGQVERRAAIALPDHDQVAEPSSAQHRGLDRHEHLVERRAHPRDVAPRVAQRRLVGDVADHGAPRDEHPADLGEGLPRGQRPGGPGLGEDIEDDQVRRRVRLAVELGAGIPDPDPDPRPARPRQPVPDEVHQRGIGLDHEVARARSRVRGVARQCHRTAAEVQHPQRSGSDQVDHVPDPAHVLEDQPAGVGEVDMGLLGSAGHQHPALRQVGVGHEDGLAATDLPGLGGPQRASSHAAIVPGPQLRREYPGR